MIDRTDVRGGGAVATIGVADPGEVRVPMECYGEVILEKKKTVAEVFTNTVKYNGKRVRELVGVFEEVLSSGSSTSATHAMSSASEKALTSPENRDLHRRTLVEFGGEGDANLTPSKRKRL